jgi:hypothetical protein
MTAPTNPQNPFTPFLPSTYNVPEEDDRWKEWLGSNLSDLSDVINDKKIGSYFQNFEVFNGEEWAYNTTKKIRNGYQFILRVESYPNTGSLTITLPIVVNEQFVVTHVWGSASRPVVYVNGVRTTPGDYFSFFSEGDSRITFIMTDLDVTITTTADMTAYSGFIIVEYLKDGF